MEVEQAKPPNSAMTFDEVSMERSKSFVKALQVNFVFFAIRSGYACILTLCSRGLCIFYA